jgi:hypothetical protein
MLNHFLLTFNHRSMFKSVRSTKRNFVIFATHKNGPIVQWIECKIPVLMIWVRIPVGSQIK